MHTRSRMGGVTLALTVAALTGCAAHSPLRAYSGPRKASSGVALVTFCQDSAANREIRAVYPRIVDQRPIKLGKRSSDKPCSASIELLPGDHTIELSLQLSVTQQGGVTTVKYGPGKATITVAGGKAYEAIGWPVRLVEVSSRAFVPTRQGN